MLQLQDKKGSIWELTKRFKPVSLQCLGQWIMLIVIRITADLSLVQLLALFVSVPINRVIVGVRWVQEVSCFWPTAAFYMPRAQGHTFWEGGWKYHLIIMQTDMQPTLGLSQPQIFVPKEAEKFRIHLWHVLMSTVQTFNTAQLSGGGVLLTRSSWSGLSMTDGWSSFGLAAALLPQHTPETTRGLSTAGWT